MHPVLSDVRKLLWYMAAWLLTGVLIAALLVETDLAGWANGLFFAIPVSIVYGFVASSAYYVCRSLPFARRHGFFAVAVFGAASVLSGFAWLAICAGWNLIGRSLGEDWTAIAISQHLAVVLFVAGFVFYLLSILAHDVLIVIENVRLAERREAESRVLARDAELQVLRTQINPHFLFNSLNSISALITIDGQAARAMTIELAQFFRQTLALSERLDIPLADEISLCEHYLAIEKIRFGKKLDCEILVAENALRAYIPPMMLQPLVENAIKHGIRDLVNGGVIRINGFVRDHWLHVSIDNPVEANPTAIAGNGLGLRNIQQRLATIYGERARVAWTRSNGLFSVELAIPLAYHASIDESRDHD